MDMPPTTAPWARATPAPFAAKAPAASKAGLEAVHGLKKRIADAKSLKAWQKSTAYSDLLAYVQQLSAAIKGRRTTDDVGASPFVLELRDALDKLSGWIDEVPPANQQMRYGNVAFRDWHARLVAYAPTLMGELLKRPATTSTTPPTNGSSATEEGLLPNSFIASAIPNRVEFEASLKLQPAQSLSANPVAVSELAGYFSESFGNATRIDYGSGHELSFLVWLRCLDKLGRLTEADRPAVVLVVFERYLVLMRQIQSTYRLEPAGSHGVWGLDDYQFLPFLLGAAQLIDHAEILPSSINDGMLIEAEGRHYLYLAAIRFICRMKKGHFGEHSPMLNDISALGSWHTVAKGLARMYEGEVLGKLPVVQHLLFGTLMPWVADGA